MEETGRNSVNPSNTPKRITFNNIYNKIPFFTRSRRMHSETESSTNRKFTGASKYVLDEELAKIVNITMALEMHALAGVHGLWVYAVDVCNRR